MDTPEAKSKNKEYVANYRKRQSALGRRARLLYLTDHEFNVLKGAMYEMRNHEDIQE